MLITVDLDELSNLLYSNLNAWQQVGGGANMMAFEFDPRTTRPEKIAKSGYFQSPDAWRAGIQMKKIIKFLDKYRIVERLE